MGEERGGPSVVARASVSPSGAVASSSLYDPKGAISQRQSFSVDLRPGETTIVSWKRLVKDSNKAIRNSASVEPPVGAHPALESRIAPEGHARHELEDVVPPSNRFSAVIQKIERLYKGRESSDEEDLDDIPDDDQYDTDDSFIDDAELDEYFQVDKSETKHNGFFVNRGKLEKTNDPISSPVHAPKKRRRRDLNNAISENAAENLPKRHLNVGGVRMKAAARNAPLVGNKLSVPSQTAKTSVGGELGHDIKSSQNQLIACVETSKQKPLDSSMKQENSISTKLPNKDISMEDKDGSKQKPGLLPSGEGASKLTVNKEHAHPIDRDLLDKGNPVQVESQHKKALKDAKGLLPSSKIRPKEGVGSSDMRDTHILASKSPLQKMKLPSLASKEGAAVRPKGTMLERAIRELENKVAELRPPAMDLQEVDASAQGIKRRLPQDIKQKLAKVARLAQSSQGRISEELINRLMSILGHVVQIKTLKRHMKEMVELGLSAKQEKEDKLQKMKNEVTEMVKEQVSILKSKEADMHKLSSDDFQDAPNSDEKGALKGRYKWDNATEDRLCDLYDQYVEGMDEDKGPQIRKLYVELAELWPEGWMDNNGIKYAVCRAKERRKRLYGHGKDGEKLRRKKISSAAVRVEENLGAAATNSQARSLQERPPSNQQQPYTSHGHLIIHNTLSSSSPRNHALGALPNRTSDSFISNEATGAILEKVRRTTIDHESGLVSKKLKRKSMEASGSPMYPSKLQSLDGKQSSSLHHHKLNKHHSSLVQHHHKANSTVSAACLPPASSYELLKNS
ncbi:hypothetical protein AMTRI_Chr11g99470 [Amborella trichopoda]|uniref:Hpc2-related domain-containing protein n=1 Tax=Amborella trichopoda TaxID=13333 RepID=W1PLX2_AMBTC|nr:ubinuclein-1 [Amborella trichopoda]ERN08754.1 hypothetical protein AMTR_s00017p00245850 [Amborella trichopoda]|eukprot:XP_006847173.1 ubinuclein-1 [Amborella trichopoda]